MPLAAIATLYEAVYISIQPTPKRINSIAARRSTERIVVFLQPAGQEGILTVPPLSSAGLIYEWIMNGRVVVNGPLLARNAVAIENRLTAGARLKLGSRSASSLGFTGVVFLRRPVISRDCW